jgi:hypothetical protein
MFGESEARAGFLFAMLILSQYSKNNWNMSPVLWLNTTVLMPNFVVKSA